MRVAIYNLEPNLNNYALDKVRTYYQSKHIVTEDYFFNDRYDEVWCSAIFSNHVVATIPDTAFRGGTGLDLTITLPPEIDACNPRKNYGFTTRGCIRNCPFCVVPRKEGKIRFDRELLDLWDGKTKDITLYDNNILALPEHFERVCNDARNNNLRLDFNQGLDHRLLNQEMVNLLKSISHKEYRFAFDSMAYFHSVEYALDLLERNSINRCLWYVLVGYDTTFGEDLERLNYLRSRNQNVYVQRYNSIHSDKRLTALSRWANQHHIFQGMTWEQFLHHPANKAYLKAFNEAIGV